MDIIDKLIESIPIVDNDNKKVLSDLLVVKLQELANSEAKKTELTQEQKDEQEIMNFNGVDHGK